MIINLLNNPNLSYFNFTLLLVLLFFHTVILLALFLIKFIYHFTPIFFILSSNLIENRNKSIKFLKHSFNRYLNWNRIKTRIMYSLNNDSIYRMYPIRNKRDFIK